MFWLAEADQSTQRIGQHIEIPRLIVTRSKRHLCHEWSILPRAIMGWRVTCECADTHTPSRLLFFSVIALYRRGRRMAIPLGFYFYIFQCYTCVTDEWLFRYCSDVFLDVGEGHSYRAQMLSDQSIPITINEHNSVVGFVSLMITWSDQCFGMEWRIY